MSATGRGTVRNEADFYPTPAWCVHRLLERAELPGGDWLEPAAGDGAIIRACHDRGDSNIHWTAVELRAECRKPLMELSHCVVGQDFLKWNSIGGYRVLLTNPPFSLAEEFVRASLPLASYCVFLLRLNFLGSAKRRALFANEMPDIYVLPNRPSFTGKGTDATEYCWMVWTPERGRTSGRIEILAETLAGQRGAAK